MPADEGNGVLIIAGWLRVAAEDRDGYLDGCREVVEVARATDGCLDFTLAADPLEPDRVVVFERWASEEALERFRGSGPEPAQAARILDATVRRYLIDRVEVA